MFYEIGDWKGERFNVVLDKMKDAVDFGAFTKRKEPRVRKGKADFTKGKLNFDVTWILNPSKKKQRLRGRSFVQMHEVLIVFPKTYFLDDGKIGMEFVFGSDVWGVVGGLNEFNVTGVYDVPSVTDDDDDDDDGAFDDDYVDF